MMNPWYSLLSPENSVPSAPQLFPSYTCRSTHRPSFRPSGKGARGVWAARPALQRTSIQPIRSLTQRCPEKKKSSSRNQARSRQSSCLCPLLHTTAFRWLLRDPPGTFVKCLQCPGERHQASIRHDYRLLESLCFVPKHSPLVTHRSAWLIISKAVCGFS